MTGQPSVHDQLRELNSAQGPVTISPPVEGMPANMPGERIHNIAPTSAWRFNRQGDVMGRVDALANEMRVRERSLDAQLDALRRQVVGLQVAVVGFTALVGIVVAVMGWAWL